MIYNKLFPLFGFVFLLSMQLNGAGASSSSAAPSLGASTSARASSPVLADVSHLDPTHALLLLSDAVLKPSTNDFMKLAYYESYNIEILYIPLDGETKTESFEAIMKTKYEILFAEMSAFLPGDFVFSQEALEPFFGDLRVANKPFIE